MLKAVLNGATVENVIVAAPDFEIEGMTLVAIPDGAPVSIGWRYEGGEFLPPTPPPITQANLFAYAAQRRWEVETGGITVGGAPIGTDDRTKVLILGKRTKALENPDGITRWKAVEGQSFVDLPNSFVIAAADAVEAHVQACFDKEGDITDAILDGEITSLDQIDAEIASISTAY